MKRQRAENGDVVPTLSFQDLMSCIRQHQNLSCDQLVALREEIDAKYAVEANQVIEHFPLDLWCQILARAYKPSYFAVFHPALLWRTVSKSWQATISKIEWARWCFKEGPPLPNQKILSFMKFNELSFHVDPSTWNLTPSLLSHTTKLHFQRVQDPSFLEHLTHLKALCFRGQTLHHKTLLPLTNLKFLKLTDCLIETISTLTNLEALTLVEPFALTHAEIKDTLPKLTCLTAATESPFFTSGKGIWENRAERFCYTGEWKNSLRHGQGECDYHDLGTYIGEWVEGEKHGSGIFSYHDKEHGYFDGLWDQGIRAGQGKRVYGNGDSYVGDWHQGTRHGQGKYKFEDDGIMYDGQWTHDMITGQGTCSYNNGDTYAGAWAEGTRHGQGVYTFKNGTQATGNWVFNEFHPTDDIVFDEPFNQSQLDPCEDPEIED